MSNIHVFIPYIPKSMYKISAFHPLHVPQNLYLILQNTQNPPPKKKWIAKAPPKFLQNTSKPPLEYPKNYPAQKNYPKYRQKSLKISSKNPRSPLQDSTL